ncbi:MAG: hypothetical protein HQL63_10945 [Magnetococcales bacterium]|nr:hypothetical protein [Magnetococcales bacterium]
MSGCVEALSLASGTPLRNVCAAMAALALLLAADLVAEVRFGWRVGGVLTCGDAAGR